VANSFQLCNDPNNFMSMNAKQICDDLELIIKEEGIDSDYA
jgi:hypothetical protein